MTYSQQLQHSDKEKVRQETTTTTISSTTTTTASSSSTMPLTSDSEPTMYSTQKSMHYTSSRASNGMKNGTSAQLHEIDNDHAIPSSRLVNGGRSSSQSSNSSSNSPALAHKGSHQGLNGQHRKTGAPSSFSNHSNGSNASLPPNKSAGSPDRHHRPAHDPSDYSSGAHSWPILFAVVPPLGALVFGKSDIWSDMLTLALIAFFLYNIIKGNKDTHARTHAHTRTHTHTQTYTRSSTGGMTPQFSMGGILSLLDGVFGPPSFAQASNNVQRGCTTTTTTTTTASLSAPLLRHNNRSAVPCSLLFPSSQEAWTVARHLFTFSVALMFVFVVLLYSLSFPRASFHLSFACVWQAVLSCTVPLTSLLSFLLSVL